MHLALKGLTTGSQEDNTEGEKDKTEEKGNYYVL
jgi:hypothetical protein